MTRATYSWFLHRWDDTVKVASEDVWDHFPEKVFEYLEEHNKEPSQPIIDFVKRTALDSPSVIEATACIRLLGILAEENYVALDEVVHVLEKILSGDIPVHRYYAVLALWQARAVVSIDVLKTQLSLETDERIKNTISRAIAVLKNYNKHPVHFYTK